MRYLVVERVGPERWVGHWGGDGAVVHEPELPHHEELAVPAYAEEGHPHPPDILHVHAAEPARRGWSEQKVRFQVFDSTLAA